MYGVGMALKQIQSLLEIEP